MLRNYFLQSFADSIASSASEWATNLSSGISLLAVIILVIAVGIVGFIFFVHHKRKYDFEGSGKAIGHFKIEIMGKYPLVGNLAEWQMIDNEQLDFLKFEEKLSAVPDVIKQMYNEKNLFIYTMKNPDDSDIIDKFGNRTFIISSGKLDSDVYSYSSQKSKFSIRNIFTKETTRTVIAYSSAYKAQVLNEDRNIDDWWIIAPIPVVHKKEVIGFNSKAIGGMIHHIEIKEITNAKALASALDFAPYVIKAQLTNAHLRNELQEVTKQLEITTIDLSSVNQKLMKKVRQLGQKEYVVRGKLEQIQKEKQNLMMVIVAVIIGSMSTMFVPTFLKSMPLQSSQFIGMILALVIVVGMAYMMNKQTKANNANADDE